MSLKNKLTTNVIIFTTALNWKTLKEFIYAALTIVFITGCRKMIEVDLPIDKNTAGQVYNDPKLATYAMTGIYGRLARGNSIDGSSLGLSIMPASLADEIFQLGMKDENHLNNLNGSMGFNFWTVTYRELIYKVNSLIEGVSASSGISEEIKSILIGEAKFTRAWLYFYLVNYYGDVPLVLEADYSNNVNISRTSKDRVFEQIIIDLLDAQMVLTDNYLDIDLSSSTQDRIRPNKSAATALLARVYLYTEQWEKAEQESSKLLENPLIYDTVPLNEVFLKNSKEAIWQLQPNLLDQEGNINTAEGGIFLPSTSRQPILKYEISPLLLNDFEADDKRKIDWVTTVNVEGVDYNIPFKYKIGNRDGGSEQQQQEFIMVLRLSEQYLIRAEARARQNKLTGDNSATSDLNIIRTRAGLNSISVTSMSELIDAIMHERRVELFTEFGHRWLDLKRLDAIDSVMSIAAPAKGGTWASYKALLPIPYDEFKSNLLLIGHQNPGYSEQ